MRYSALSTGYNFVCVVIWKFQRAISSSNSNIYYYHNISCRRGSSCSISIKIISQQFVRKILAETLFSLIYIRAAYELLDS